MFNQQEDSSHEVSRCRNCSARVGGLVVLDTEHDGIDRVIENAHYVFRR